MKIKFLGHSAFLIDDLLTDPFIKNNPICPIKVEDIKCKIICVTHDHHDHLGDAFEIAKNNDATIVGIYDMVKEADEKGLKTELMNIGGPIKVENWEIRLVPATHSGNPIGFVLKKDNKTIYHAGDTGLFMDMMLIGEYNIDVALLPIGGRYTMDIEQAVEACKMLKCKKVIPMHYNTWNTIEANPEGFKKKAPCDVIILKSGETFEV
ncbi:MAG: metal-dependent hydrolase [Candidatus Aenigmarchaeota archaeon]|nr:metal-dependent hydrolase [Candidatus Aenigmarchaeota archaeon]